MLSHPKTICRSPRRSSSEVEEEPEEEEIVESVQPSRILSCRGGRSEAQEHRRRSMARIVQLRRSMLNSTHACLISASVCHLNKFLSTNLWFISLSWALTVTMDNTSGLT